MEELKYNQRCAPLSQATENTSLKNMTNIAFEEGKALVFLLTLIPPSPHSPSPILSFLPSLSSPSSFLWPSILLKGSHLSLPHPYLSHVFTPSLTTLLVYQVSSCTPRLHIPQHVLSPLTLRWWLPTPLTPNLLTSLWDDKLTQIQSPLPDTSLKDPSTDSTAVIGIRYKKKEKI